MSYFSYPWILNSTVQDFWRLDHRFSVWVLGKVISIWCVRVRILFSAVRISKTNLRRFSKTTSMCVRSLTFEQRKSRSSRSYIKIKMSTFRSRRFNLILYLRRSQTSSMTSCSLAWKNVTCFPWVAVAAIKRSCAACPTCQHSKSPSASWSSGHSRKASMRIPSGFSAESAGRSSWLKSHKCSQTTNQTNS